MAMWADGADFLLHLGHVFERVGAGLHAGDAGNDGGTRFGRRELEVLLHGGVDDGGQVAFVHRFGGSGDLRRGEIWRGSGHAGQIR